MNLREKDSKSQKWTELVQNYSINEHWYLAVLNLQVVLLKCCFIHMLIFSLSQPFIELCVFSILAKKSLGE
jgi:hypothetical protein